MTAEQWTEPLELELRERFAAFERLDDIAREMSISRNEVAEHAAALGLGRAAAARSAAARVVITRGPARPPRPPLPVYRGPILSPRQARNGFVDGIVASVRLAELARAIECAAIHPGGMLLGKLLDDVRGLLLGLGCVRLGYSVAQVAALTGTSAPAVYVGRAFVRRRLEQREALEALIGTVLPLSRRPTIRAIKATVARLCGVKLIDLESVRRTRDCTRARHLAMALCRLLLTVSLPEIGRHFGKRDHTTVLHAVRETDRRGLAGYVPAPGETLEAIVLEAARRTGVPCYP